MSIQGKFQNKRYAYTNYIRVTPILLQQIIDKENLYINAYLQAEKPTEALLQRYLMYYDFYLQRLAENKIRKTICSSAEECQIISNKEKYITYQIKLHTQEYDFVELGYDESLLIKARKPKIQNTVFIDKFLSKLKYTIVVTLIQYVWSNFLTKRGYEAVYLTIITYFNYYEMTAYVLSNVDDEIIFSFSMVNKDFIYNKDTTNIYTYKDSLILENGSIIEIQNNFYNEIYIPSVFKELHQYLINDLSKLVMNYI